MARLSDAFIDDRATAAHASGDVRHAAARGQGVAPDDALLPDLTQVR
jgi:hypothetical protein